MLFLVKMSWIKLTVCYIFVTVFYFVIDVFTFLCPYTAVYHLCLKRRARWLLFHLGAETAAKRKLLLKLLNLLTLVYYIAKTASSWKLGRPLFCS